MDKNFTDRARKVMKLADQYAKRKNHTFLDTCHVLIGLATEIDGVAANVLNSHGATLEKLTKAVDESFTAGPEVVSTGSNPRTPRLKQAIVNAEAFAKELGHKYIGTEHLLYGVLYDDDGSAAVTVIKSFGLWPFQLRNEIRGLIAPATVAKSTTVYVIGEPLEVHATRETALESLAKCLRSELDYIKTVPGRWAVGKALDTGEVLMALALWEKFKLDDRSRLRFEEHEVKTTNGE